MNTAFNYLYRDAGNYKNWGRVVFAGPLTVKRQRRLREALESGQFFIAHQVRIPEVFLWNANVEYDPAKTAVGPAVDGQPGPYRICEDDHCWHEWDDCRETDQEPDDVHGRTLEEFVAELKAAAAKGWEEFQPIDRRTNLKTL